MNPSADELLSRLRGVTGPELTPPAEPASMTWVYWLLAVLIAIAIAWLFRRRPPVVISAVDEALAGLATAESSSGLDTIVRTFLQRMLDVPAKQMTTAELLGRIPPHWHSLLEASDRLRFSGVQPDESEWSGLLRRAEVLIQADGGELAGRRTARSGVNSH